jgi:hypothetical protein
MTVSSRRKKVQVEKARTVVDCRNSGKLVLGAVVRVARRCAARVWPDPHVQQVGAVCTQRKASVSLANQLNARKQTMALTDPSTS